MLILHVFIFLSRIVLFCSILTYVVPSGSYERTTKVYENAEQTVIVPGSYHVIPKHFSLKGPILGADVKGEASPTSVLGLFSSIPKGLNQAWFKYVFPLLVGLSVIATVFLMIAVAINY